MAQDASQDGKGLDEIVEWALLRLGKRLVLGTPLGLGKPNPLVNAFYRKARRDRSIKLEIVTALSLDLPQGASELERRFLEPFVDRHFGADYPRLEYVVDLARRKVPDNVQITEFYFQSGSRLGNPDAQRHYISSNYTHVARDFVDRGANLILQLVAEGEFHGRPMLSLSSNPDVTLELKARMEELPNHRCLFIAQVHPDLPFLHGDALVERDFFDCIVESPARHRLFAVPRGMVSTRDYWVGLHASALIADGGTLQIGIGSLSDALVYALTLRNEDNDRYRSLLESGGSERAGKLIDRIGGRGFFESGLFGASEMFMDGFMHLYRAGILKRPAYDDEVLQDLADGSRLPEAPDRGLIEHLWEGRSLPRQLEPDSLAHWQHLGVLDRRLELADDMIVPADGAPFPNDLRRPANRAALADRCLGQRLAPGILLEAAFFLGSAPFYEWLRQLDEDERRCFVMSSVGRINQLYGGRESLELKQRRGARFVNTAMMITATGAAVSDGLKDYQMVSGVGGQYNFVAMAHAMRQGRSILLARAVRDGSGGSSSNIVWDYPHITIPRHLRDIVVTEYGIADLRGKSDEECIEAMIALTDTRFQQELAHKAIEAGKLRRDYRVPDRVRDNTPERLEELLGVHRREGLFPPFPFGSDFNETERELIPALRYLKENSSSYGRLLRGVLTGRADSHPAAMERMGLSRPSTLKQRLYRRLLAWALDQVGDR